MSGLEPTSRKFWKAGSLSWGFTAVSILIAIISLVIAIRGALTSGDYRTILSHQTLTPFVTTGFAVVGALIASRHPRNSIGWIFVTIGVLYALIALSAAIYVYGSAASPLYRWAYWFGSWLWLPGTILPVTFLLLVFPDGHLPAKNWRFVAWPAGLGLAMIVLGVMGHPGPLKSWGLEVNPFGIQGAAPVLDILLNLGSVLVGIGILGSMAAFFIRFRRSAGIEREQMKWLIYAVGMFLLASALSSIAWVLWPDSPWKMDMGITITNLGILGIAVGAAIAVLRYRLFDIDLIINRTLV